MKPLECVAGCVSRLTSSKERNAKGRNTMEFILTIACIACTIAGLGLYLNHGRGNQ